MATITLNVPDSWSITRYGATVTVDPATLPEAIWLAMAQDRWQAKVGDAAANTAANLVGESYDAKLGHKVGSFAALPVTERRKLVGDYTADKANESALCAAALPAMQKVADALLAGEWTQRRASEGLSQDQTDVAVYLRDVQRVPHTKLGYDEAAWKGMKTADRVKAFWAFFAGLPEAKQALVREAMASPKLDL